MTLVLPAVDSPNHEYLPDNWVWDHESKSPEVVLSSNHQAAYFHIDPVADSQGTAGVRGTKGFIDGEHYWEIIFLEPPIGSSVMVGVGTKKALLHTSNYQYVNLVGMDENSWGLSYKGSVWHAGKRHPYCQPFYKQNTIIGVHLDLYRGTLSFYRNREPLGVAFTGLDKLNNQELYPIMSSTAVDSEMEVGVRVGRHPTLQEKCFLTVARRLRDKDDIDVLPLPTLMKKGIMGIN